MPKPLKTRRTVHGVEYDIFRLLGGYKGRLKNPAELKPSAYQNYRALCRELEFVRRLRMERESA